MVARSAEDRRASPVLYSGNGKNCVMERKRTGRPPKGNRRLVAYRLPNPLLDAVREHAARRGMTATDLVGELLAAGVGMPYEVQEGLPLNKAS